MGIELQVQPEDVVRVKACGMRSAMFLRMINGMFALIFGKRRTNEADRRRQRNLHVDGGKAGPWCDYAVGTEVYYAGDDAEPEGFGQITAVHPDAHDIIPAMYDIRLGDGRLMGVAMAAFDPKEPDRDWQTREEWEAIQWIGERWVKVTDGYPHLIFEGNVDMFRECFFDNADWPVVVAWAKLNGYTIELDPWVLCSERMPEQNVPVLVRYEGSDSADCCARWMGHQGDWGWVHFYSYQGLRGKPAYWRRTLRDTIFSHVSPWPSQQFS